MKNIMRFIMAPLFAITVGFASVSAIAAQTDLSFYNTSSLFSIQLADAQGGGGPSAGSGAPGHGGPGHGSGNSGGGGGGNSDGGGGNSDGHAASGRSGGGGGEGGIEPGDEMPWPSSGASERNERVNCEELCLFPFPDPLSPAGSANPDNDEVNARK